MSLRSAVPVPSGPDGRPWVVRRRWAPRLGHETLWGRFRRRMRTVAERGLDLGSGVDVGCMDDLLAALALIAVAAFVVLVVLPLLVALVEVVVLLVLVLLGVVAKIVLRRPFVVEALHADPPVEQVLRWRVVGWGASADRCRELAQLLEAGMVPPDAEQLTVRGRPGAGDAGDDDPTPVP